MDLKTPEILKLVDKITKSILDENIGSSSKLKEMMEILGFSYEIL